MCTWGSNDYKQLCYDLNKNTSFPFCQEIENSMFYFTTIQQVTAGSYSSIIVLRTSFTTIYVIFSLFLSFLILISIIYLMVLIAIILFLYINKKIVEFKRNQIEKIEKEIKQKESGMLKIRLLDENIDETTGNTLNEQELNLLKSGNSNKINNDKEVNLITAGPQLFLEKALYIIKFSELSNFVEIGSGGSGGIVCVADWNGIRVAVKLFSRTDFQNTNNFENFEKELKLFSSLRHRNIVSFYGAAISEKKTGLGFFNFF
jgi:uncharacterized membrane protein